MTDPLGLIGSGGGVGPIHNGPNRAAGQKNDPNGPSFRDVFMDTLHQADKLQQDATKAAEDFQTGKRDDLEGVIMATQKAETAFKMIQSLRNKV